VRWHAPPRRSTSTKTGADGRARVGQHSGVHVRQQVRRGRGFQPRAPAVPGLATGGRPSLRQPPAPEYTWSKAVNRETGIPPPGLSITLYPWTSCPAPPDATRSALRSASSTGNRLAGRGSWCVSAAVDRWPRRQVAGEPAFDLVGPDLVGVAVRLPADVHQGLGVREHGPWRAIRCRWRASPPRSAGLVDAADRLATVGVPRHGVDLTGRSPSMAEGIAGSPGRRPSGRRGVQPGRRAAPAPGERRHRLTGRPRQWDR
jgi:hypothetical protein